MSAGEVYPNGAVGEPIGAADVSPDKITLNHIARPAIECDAFLVKPGDDVAFTGIGPADEAIVHILKRDRIAASPEILCAGRVRADKIALDDRIVAYGNPKAPTPDEIAWRRAGRRSEPSDFD